jgi:hypothetical protein
MNRLWLLTLLFLLGCVTDPIRYGQIEHTGLGTIRLFKPETRWSSGALTHQTDFGFTKTLDFCDGLRFPMWVGERLDITFRWVPFSGDKPRECFEILDVKTQQ